jgi:hypothetical protein
MLVGSAVQRALMLVMIMAESSSHVLVGNVAALSKMLDVSAEIVIGRASQLALCKCTPSRKHRLLGVPGDGRGQLPPVPAFCLAVGGRLAADDPALARLVFAVVPDVNGRAVEVQASDQREARMRHQSPGVGSAAQPDPRYRLKNGQGSA